MDTLRRPFLVAALVSAAVAVAMSLGAPLFTGPPALADRISGVLSDPTMAAQLAERGVDVSQAAGALSAMTAPADPPGLALPYLGLIDGLLLLVLILTALPTVVGDRITGSVQGIVSIIGGLVGLLGSIVLAVVAFGALMLMVSLFLAAPFGTLAYLAIFGFFDTSGAAVILGLITAAQLATWVTLVLAQQRFLKSKGLMLLLATCLLASLVTGVLHSIVPTILVSITDALAALIIAVVAAIWSLVVLIGGIVSAVKLLSTVNSGTADDPTRAGS